MPRKSSKVRRVMGVGNFLVVLSQAISATIPRLHSAQPYVSAKYWVRLGTSRRDTRALPGRRDPLRMAALRRARGGGTVRGRHDSDTRRASAQASPPHPPVVRHAAHVPHHQRSVQVRLLHRGERARIRHSQDGQGCALAPQSSNVAIKVASLGRSNPHRPWLLPANVAHPLVVASRRGPLGQSHRRDGAQHTPPFLR